jgi:hypothetical protein
MWGSTQMVLHPFEAKLRIGRIDRTKTEIVGERENAL